MREITPKISIDEIFEIQTIHPKAMPTVLAIPKTANIPAMAAG